MKNDKEMKLNKYKVYRKEYTILELLIFEKYQKRIKEYTQLNDVGIEDLNLSVRSCNCLKNQDYKFLSDIILKTQDMLLDIPGMGMLSAIEMSSVINDYLINNQDDIYFYANNKTTYMKEYKNKKKADDEINKNSILELIKYDKYKKKIEAYFKYNDMSVEDLELSVRSKNILINNNYYTLYDILFLEKDVITSLKGMGSKSLNEILQFNKNYLISNEDNIVAFCKGDSSCVFTEQMWKKKVSAVFSDVGFNGISIEEIIKNIKMPKNIEISFVEKTTDSLVRDRLLTKKGDKYFYNYMSYLEYVNIDKSVKPDDIKIINKKLEGQTLEEIAKDYGVTRERIRQKIKKIDEKIRRNYYNDTGMKIFKEDVFDYIYTTYDIDKEVYINYIRLPKNTYNYLNMFFKSGDKPIEQIMHDDNINPALKNIIIDYLNRNKIELDGELVLRNRQSIEDFVIKKYCKEEMTYDEYCKFYNNYLKQNNIDFDEKIYCTEDVIRSRQNRLADSRFVLWKQNQKLRYYDVDSRDYTELLEKINLSQYNNIEISTLKIFSENIKLMKKYDIRDQYELHNLLKKIIAEDSFNSIKFKRMPTILFGNFDRDKALYDLLLDNSPISLDDFASLINNNFGYDINTIKMNYLNPLMIYYSNGLFNVCQSSIPDGHIEILKKLLIEDFYYIDEVKKIYKSEIIDSEVDNLSSYVIKTLGFEMYSTYILRKGVTLEKYFTNILTINDVIDITDYEKRFKSIQTWYYIYKKLQADYEIIEFEKNQIITYKKLQDLGISKEDIKSYCDKVYDFIGDNQYFTSDYLEKEGFQDSLYELGFSNYFYRNLLYQDNRFAHKKMFDDVLFCKRDSNISIATYIEDYIRENGSSDLSEIIYELENKYGFTNVDKNKLIQKNTLFYDSFLERIYPSEKDYYDEI